MLIYISGLQPGPCEMAYIPVCVCVCRGRKRLRIAPNQCVSCQTHKQCFSLFHFFGLVLSFRTCKILFGGLFDVSADVTR